MLDCKVATEANVPSLRDPSIFVSTMQDQSCSYDCFHKISICFVLLQQTFQDLALAGQACSLAVMAAVKQLMRMHQQAQQAQQQAISDPPGSRQLQEQRYETLQAAVSLQSSTAPETVVAALQAAQASLEASVTNWACSHLMQLHRSMVAETKRANEAEERSLGQQQQLERLEAEGKGLKASLEEV
jgi:hypothetical protein